MLQIELPLRSLFEAPTIAGWAERVEAALRTEQDVIAPPIVPVSHAGELPLSFAQQRLWFLDQLRPGSSLYNMPMAVQLSRKLNIWALEQSLGEIVRRHEMLRTTFSTIEDRVVQVIRPVGDCTVQRVDLTELAKEERKEELQRLVNAEALRSFDLACDPLLRKTLVQLDENEHALLLLMHHIAFDGWSKDVFLHEIAALYAAFSAGKPSPLAELAVQYADFAIWQRQWLQGKVLEDQLGYWKKQLAGATPLKLPTDRPASATRSHREKYIPSSYQPSYLRSS